jgi:DNA-binding FrmR family transcriptional regulator
MLDEEKSGKLDRRLLRIEGQVRGIRKMIEARRYCVDLLDQIAAARAALGAVSQEILRDHIGTCVTEALSGSDRRERERKIEELVRLFPRFCRGG